MNSEAANSALSIDALNAATRRAFMAALGGIVEHLPSVAERAFLKRPLSFSRRPACQSDRLRPGRLRAEKIALFNRHPELAGKEAVAGVMTERSTSEQGRLGLDRLPPAQFERLSLLNRAYREKFGFPFIAAVRLHRDLESLFGQFESRLRNDVKTEVDLAVQQISEILFGRLSKLFAMEAGNPL